MTTKHENALRGELVRFEEAVSHVIGYIDEAYYPQRGRLCKESVEYLSEFLEAIEEGDTVADAISKAMDCDEHECQNCGTPDSKPARCEYCAGVGRHDDPAGSSIRKEEG